MDYKCRHRVFGYVKPPSLFLGGVYQLISATYIPPVQLTLGPNRAVQASIDNSYVAYQYISIGDIHKPKSNGMDVGL